MLIAFWFFIALFFFLMELGHPGLFFCLSFACGALVALAVACVDADNLLIQSGSFFAGTLIAWCVLRCLIHKEVHQHHRTNVDALQGCQGIVLTDITPLQAGSVKVGGQIWAALSLHQEPIYKNTPIEVIRVRGVHLVVTPIIIKT